MIEAKIQKMFSDLAKATAEIFDTDPLVMGSAMVNYLNEVDDSGDWTITDIKLPADKCWNGEIL